MQSPTDINLRRVLVGHRAAVNVVDFDDKYIVSASGDRTIKVISVLKMPHKFFKDMVSVRLLLKLPSNSPKLLFSQTSLLFTHLSHTPNTKILSQVKW